MMKARLATYALVLVLAILALILARRLAHPSTGPETADQRRSSEQASGKQPGNYPTAFKNRGAEPSKAVPARPRARDNTPNDEGRELESKEWVESQNVPVRFYGIVIDQDSNVLSGVRVQLGVRHNVHVIPKSAEAAQSATLRPDELQKVVSPTTEAVTDANGRFQWSGPGVTGDVLGVGSITKEGYEAQPGLRSFNAGDGTPDEPVVFKMWNTNIHEQLLSGQKVFRIMPDGRPYVIDLTKGTIAESGAGDIKVWIKRPDQITYGDRYDWSCELDALNGNEILRETNATEAMFVAPADGYTNSFVHEEGATVNGWGDTTGQQRFYVRLNNGQEYARISVELEAYYNKEIPGVIRLSYAINPSGSRVLR